MSVAGLDLAFNVGLLLFWLLIWEGVGGLMFNPYLTLAERIGRRVTDFLRPALPRLPDQGLALVAFLFLLLVRALVMPAGGGALPGPPWTLRLGFEVVALPTGGLLSRCTFSLLSWCVFLFQLCALALLFLGIYRPDNRLNLARDMVERLTRPLSLLGPLARPAMLLLAGGGLLVLLHLGGQAVSPMRPLTAMPATLALLRLLVATLAAVADQLLAARSVLIALILGSWLGLATQSLPLQYLCRDWLDLFLGPLRRLPLQTGTVDMTPLVAFLLLAVLHAALAGTLYTWHLNLLAGGTGP